MPGPTPTPRRPLDLSKLRRSILTAIQVANAHHAETTIDGPPSKNSLLPDKVNK